MNVKSLIDNITALEAQCAADLASGNRSLVSIKQIQTKLSTHYHNSKKAFRKVTFSTKQNEIDYFKLFNSQLIKLCLYYKEIYHIESSLISKSKKKKLKILQAHINRLDLISGHHQSFITYISEESTHFDEAYFLSTSRDAVRNEGSFDRDPEFSTFHSYLLGHILSILQTLCYIDQKLQQLRHGYQCVPTIDSTKWTASKTDFVELVYAIHSSGAVDIEISKLFTLLSQVIDTGPLDQYNKWNNIKNRANNQPRFLPKILQSLQSKIDQDFD